jgi:glycosyltransferase involved in cell wall biosynthesis
VIGDGANGLLVPERDPAALAAAIGRLLADDGLARALGDAARQRVQREHGWDAVARQFEAAYAAARDRAGAPRWKADTQRR